MARLIDRRGGNVVMQVLNRLLHQVQYAERVIQTAVLCAGVRQVANTQLVDTS